MRDALKECGWVPKSEVDWAVDWAVAEPTGLAMGERQVTVPDLVILTS